jgi:hypothetical protein
VEAVARRVDAAGAAAEAAARAAHQVTAAHARQLRKTAIDA